jgi:ParB family chromosome partitioning protein
VQPVNTNLNTVPGITFAEIELNLIKPNAKQPRQVFEEESLNELTFSLKEIGLLQPIVVRALANNEYEIVAGERRFRAAKLAGFTKIPALIRDTQDTHMLRDALLENLHRAQLNPLEEAAAYQQLLEDFGGTQEELAAKLGRSRPQVTNTMRLLKLPPTVQKRVAAGVLSSGHAKALLGLAQSGDIEILAGRIVAEGLSVRATEEIVSMGTVGGSSGTAARKLPALKAPGLKELSDRLGDKLDTRVSITMGKAKGKVIIEFSTLEDLRRIVDEIEKN